MAPLVLAERLPARGGSWCPSRGHLSADLPTRPPRACFSDRAGCLLLGSVAVLPECWWASRHWRVAGLV